MEKGNLSNLEVEQDPPKKDPVEEAKKVLEEHKTSRLKACSKEIEQALEKYGCALSAEPVPHPTPGVFTFRIFLVPK